jgi:outer membrane receptor for ferrienterochelin and colicins
MAMRFGRQLIAALALCLSTAAALAAQQTGTISGRVMDVESGAPVAGASIEVVGGNGRVVATGLSDPEGNFRIPNVPVGSYGLVFMSAGHRTTRLTDIRVVAGETAMAGVSLPASAIVLNPVVVSPTRGVVQKASTAPASTWTTTSEQIEERPTVTPVDHLRSTPGVDVITTGLQSTNVVARGFNNIFSGSLHTLTDYRIAGVPSLRVNFMHFIPQSNDDIERMEVVLGPASALYGPNTANGVLHMLTKSPLRDQGTTVSFAGGEREVYLGTFRTAQKLSEFLGVKISGQWLQGQEWVYRDPVEETARQVYNANPAIFAAEQPPGLSQAEIDRRRALVANRDFNIERYSGDVRVDFSPSPDFLTVFSGGFTNANGLELTGIGAGQAVDWTYTYAQVRTSFKRLFAQVYMNGSDSGETYLLRTGKPISDQSKVYVGQLQHGFSVGTLTSGTEVLPVQSFVYGVDVVATRPETAGTINGANEDRDNYEEVGAYLQSQTAVASWLDLVLAGRYDKHSELPDPVFSPRAALVFKPGRDHTFRATYNQAFSTPTSLNLFLDIDGGRVTGLLGQLGFRIHAQGPGRDGFSFKNGGSLTGMRSPFAAVLGQQPSSLLPVTTTNLYDLQLTGLVAASAAAGTPLSPQLVTAMRSFRTDPALSAITLGMMDPNREGAVIPFNLDNVPDVPGIQESTTSTIEFGYKGIIGGRLLLAADAWWSQHKNFTSPLIAQTPLLQLNRAQLQSFMEPRVRDVLMAGGMPLMQAQATAATLAQTMAQIPGAVVSSDQVNASGADVLATYRNFGNVKVNGIDLAATALLTDAWQVGLTASLVSDDHFRVPLSGVEQIVALNAPRLKGSANLAYRNLLSGLSAEVRMRYTDEFPANSAGYVGLNCIDSALQGDCVKAYTLLDVTAGYRLPLPGASLQLSVTNALDEKYQSFIGTPAIGRMALLRLRYDF